MRVGGIKAAGPQDKTNRISLFGEDGDVAGPDDGDGEPEEGEDGDPEHDPPDRFYVGEQRVRVLQLVDHWLRQDGSLGEREKGKRSFTVCLYNKDK